jgi:hypothetical protein
MLLILIINLFKSINLIYLQNEEKNQFLFSSHNQLHYVNYQERERERENKFDFIIILYTEIC